MVASCHVSYFIGMFLRTLKYDECALSTVSICLSLHIPGAFYNATILRFCDAPLGLDVMAIQPERLYVLG